MWKDPLFSTALVLTTVLLMDFVLSKGTILKTSKAWLPCLAILLLIVMFSRNNGIYVVVCTEIILLVYWLTTRKKFKHSFAHIGKLTGSIACTLALCLVVTGPVYRALDVASSPKVESVGILLNQMARVAALDDDMTESDREYLSSSRTLSLMWHSSISSMTKITHVSKVRAELKINSITSYI